MKTCCVIIPMHGKEEYTRRCIDLCKERAGIEIDIVVIDDASPTPFIHGDTFVIRNCERRGYTESVNTGIIWSIRDYQYVLLLNNDTEPEQDFIKKMVEVADSDKSIGIVSPARIENRSGIMFAELDQIDILRGFHNTVLLKDLKDELIYCNAVAAACYLIPTSIITEIGLLDKTMSMFCTDTDYCFRVIMAGYKIVVATAAKIFHHRSVTVKSLNLDADPDMQKFLEKMAGYNMAKILKDVPLDMERGTYGRLTFEIMQK